MPWPRLQKPSYMQCHLLLHHVSCHIWLWDTLKWCLNGRLGLIWISQIFYCHDWKDIRTYELRNCLATVNTGCGIYIFVQYLCSVQCCQCISLDIEACGLTRRQNIITRMSAFVKRRPTGWMISLGCKFSGMKRFACDKRGQGWTRSFNYCLWSMNGSRDWDTDRGGWR